MEARGVLELFELLKPIIEKTNDEEQAFFREYFLKLAQVSQDMKLAFDNLIQAHATIEIQYKKINELQAQQMVLLRKIEIDRRLRFLGEMATGTAHQINQPVGIIRAATSRMRADIRDNLVTPERLESYVDNIWQQTERLNAIIKRFQERARADRTPRTKVNLNALIQETYQAVFAEQFQHRNISIEFELDETNPVVFANPYELEEVLVVLLNNARDALEERTESKVRIQTVLKSDNCVIFAVEDNGPGLSEDYQKHLFMPLMSTKSTEKGTGIGLYVVWDIVTHLGGKISYDENYTNGARFVVELPPVELAEKEQTRDGTPI